MSNMDTILSNVIKRIPQNFEAIVGLQAELCLVKFQKLDACIQLKLIKKINLFVLLLFKGTPQIE